MQTWAYGGHDRTVLGSIVPDLYTSFDNALNSAKEAVESFGTEGYVYDDVNNVLYTFDGIKNWTKEQVNFDDDDIWDLTEGSIDYSSVACIFASHIE